MTGPLTEMGFRAMAQTIQALRKKNHTLSTRNGQYRDDRDKWRELAIKRRKELENLRRRLKRCREQNPLPLPRPPVKRRSATVAELIEHRRIVERIKRIPPRDDMVGP